MFKQLQYDLFACFSSAADVTLHAAKSLKPCSDRHQLCVTKPSTPIHFNEADKAGVPTTRERGGGRPAAKLNLDAIKVHAHHW